MKEFLANMEQHGGDVVREAKVVTLTVSRLEAAADARIDFNGDILELQRSMEAALVYYIQELHRCCGLDERQTENALKSIVEISSIVARRKEK